MFTESSSKKPRLYGLRVSAKRSSTGRRFVRGIFPNETTEEKSSGGPKPAVSAKNATTQRKGNVQKMHIALKRWTTGQGVLPESWTATRAKNASVQMVR